MLHNFPTPYPDELFYSMCARYSRRVSYPDAKTFALRVLGSRNALAVVDLPTHLEHFAEQVSSNFGSAQEMIDRHTLLPFYRPFLPAEHVREVEAAMLGSGFVHHSLGVMASSVSSPPSLRYCPLCVQQDARVFGEPFWRRVHQVTGVKVCPEHKVFLEDSTVAIGNRRNRHFYFAAQDVLTPGVSVQNLDSGQPLHQTLLAVATDAAWLLDQTLRTSDLSSLKNSYGWLLAEQGYATYAGRVRTSKLVEQLREFYEELCLEKLQCTLPTDQAETWLHRLVRRPRTSHHPLRHLLLMRFLGQTPETFFASPVAPPFGKGP